MNNNLTLLYVEDNEIVRENFALIFAKYFKNIITTDNGLDALKIYEQNDIDVAILDISIPGMNGLDVAHTIREQDDEIELIMLTGHSEKEKLLKAINLHLFSYLVKPVKKDELTTIMSRLNEKLADKNIIKFSYDYTYNTNLELLFYKKDSIKISKNEKKLLNFLCLNPSSHFSACDISNAIFEDTDKEDISCNNVIQLISRFKRKMLQSYNQESFFIDNIYGLGYKINM